MDLLGGVMNFSTVDAFGCSGDWVDFGAHKCEGFKGRRGAQRTDRFKQIFSQRCLLLVLFWLHMKLCDTC